VQTLNTVELPANAAAAAAVNPAIVSDTLFCASPMGLTGGVGGALMMSLADSTIAERTHS
jgi:hypothetical protein